MRCNILLEFTIEELIIIRDAVREFRTTVPDKLKNNVWRLHDWREYREMYGPELASVDKKTTEAIASTV